jgi:type 2A phosphatase activator TIP41
MLFDHSNVTLSHEASGTCISLNALDALREWRVERLPPLQVSSATTWQNARKEEIKMQRAVQLEWDWTYTTPYTGSVSSPSSSTSLAWTETKEQIDRGLLMERDPIIFYDEVDLYESDLDDNGICQLSIKIRVMPKVWFVLMRLFVRVDGLMVRLRETRLFCRHDLPEASNVVLREVKHAEGTFEELRRAGAPNDGPAYFDVDATSSALQAVAPVGVQLFKIERIEL